MLQNLITSGVYWSWPKLKSKSNALLELNLPKGYDLYKFKIYPKNKFGQQFKWLLDTLGSDPHFAIKKHTSKNQFYVRLIIYNKLLSKQTLLDIWEPQNDELTQILSTKLRSWYKKK